MNFMCFFYYNYLSIIYLESKRPRSFASIGIEIIPITTMIANCMVWEINA